MTDQDRALLVETSQIARSNSVRLDAVEKTVEEMREEQKSIYELASAVKCMAVRMEGIENKTNVINTKVDDQSSVLNGIINEPSRKAAKKVEDFRTIMFKTIAQAIATGAVGLLGALVAMVGFK